ncbi:MAG: hypothetical protein Q9166_004055 [cf. Caloplaca sp. 2 TL-2023]
MVKRKRLVEDDGLSSKVAPKDISNGTGRLKKVKSVLNSAPVAIQIIVGTYERILHGITATVIYEQDDPVGKKSAIEFADTFLFNAHGSAIRCLALSPPSKSDKVTLASGSSDQTINLYHVSARRFLKRIEGKPALPNLGKRKTVENPKNRELGSLQHHAASINALKFPTRSKLLSAADDSTIGVARTRDWTVLSTIKIPIPKAHGRPSGDTAPLGGTPAGVNDFAIHPSLKLMVSVSKGEKCMRLWNLVTGKKAGVLNFDKALLQAVGEGRWGRGEGYRVEWNGYGEEFAVSFEKGAVVFGLVSFLCNPDVDGPNAFGQDSRPKGIITVSPPSKIHQIHYVDLEVDENRYPTVLAISTEDGRVIFFSTTPNHVPDRSSPIPVCLAIGQIGGEVEEYRSRVKDFEYLNVTGYQATPETSLIVTGSSDGTIGVWTLDSLSKLRKPRPTHRTIDAPGATDGEHGDQTASGAIPEIGRLLGKYETGNRITCLKGFVMTESIDKGELAHPISNVRVETNRGAGTMSDDSSDSV